MQHPIARPSETVSRRTPSVLVLGLAGFLLGWLGVGFWYQPQRCAHADGKTTMHEDGLCLWSCAAPGQDLGGRLPEWPALLMLAGFPADGSTGNVRWAFMGAFEGRGPPTTAAPITWSP
jgi:hypothetical protein